MQLEVNNEVFFIHKNTIYKGVVNTVELINADFTIYNVKSPIGLTYFKQGELYSSINKLVQAITYEEPVRASQEFKTWAVT
jgi:hypothetical protein